MEAAALHRISTALGGLVVLALSLLLSALFAPSAQSAFPGGNGKIAFSSDRDGNDEVYVIDADGSHPRDLTRNPAADTGLGHPSPSWSPDGRQLAFTTRRDGNLEIYVMNADGSGQRDLTRSAGNDQAPAWSPDGRTIAFVTERHDRSDIEIAGVDGRGLRRLTHSGDVVDVAWSPDGSRLAFTRAGHGKVELYVANADGSAIRQLTHTRGGGSSDPAWAPAPRKG